MNQGKLDEVKQEMVRMNIDIWGISEKVNLIQETIISTTVGKNPLESKKWNSPHSQQESKMQYLDAVSKTTEWPLFISKVNHSTSQ